MEQNDEIFSRAGACARRPCTCRDRRAGRRPLRAERLLSLLSPPLAMARRSRRRILQYHAIPRATISIARSGLSVNRGPLWLRLGQRLTWEAIDSPGVHPHPPTPRVRRGFRGGRAASPSSPSRWIEMAPAPKEVCLAATKLKDFICAASRHLKILSQHRPQRAAERSVVCAKSRAGSPRLSGTQWRVLLVARCAKRPMDSTRSHKTEVCARAAAYARFSAPSFMKTHLT